MVAEVVSLEPVLRVAGLIVLSFLTAALVAVAYRWYVRVRVPGGVALLAGVSAVALYLNTRGALGQVVAGQTGYLTWEAVVFNSLSFLLGALVTPLGRRGGDRLAVSVMAMAGSQIVEGEVSTLVGTVGRLVSLSLPETIHDIDGYDPASEGVKDALAGKTLLFPRRGGRPELENRLRARIKDDYDVGYVDLDVAPDGTVEYLALGRRVAGIGPTLGPGGAAVAVEADPPNAASAGDVVQVWKTGAEKRRVATGEVRGVAGDVVTLALDETEARTLAGNRYRLLTLPSEPTADREFAALLRAAEETMAAINVDPGSQLVDATVGDLGATVVAVKPTEDAVDPVPPMSRPLAAGDLVYVVASPATIRQLEERAAAT
ncbi:TrkA, K+ transport system, NAD-binding component [Halanaeroarchaeum sp. HSR-CO]|uniref:TrkA C-terminal domain-containing protein n=1 Tax=Halanaeroarchaeum sp. HSR-CO TaxID=2866382 RepID=UPI00217CC3A1|nr:TrkA C-terminal domain-containing protein [Halanaeroarchaeum sp. HSR-CO]UWG48795.1 TrkA, K+ transport system, NAD-binding component [Halanaeroarchaeum sp. HSR-CO]